MLCQFLLMMHLTTVFQIKLKSLEHELHSQYCLTGEIPSIMYNKTLLIQLICFYHFHIYTLNLLALV